MAQLASIGPGCSQACLGSIGGQYNGSVPDEPGVLEHAVILLAYGDASSRVKWHLSVACIFMHSFCGMLHAVSSF